MNVAIELNGPIIVIEQTTGIRYTAQVGGLACLHPVVEGFILPTNWISLLQQDGLGSEISRLSCDWGCGGMPVAYDGLRQMEAIWPMLPSYYRLDVRLDESRWDQSTEAWIPIRLESRIEPNDPDYLRDELEPLDNLTGFLVLDNCD